MRNQALIFLLFLCVVPFCFAAADRGAIPGELWIIGPDISVDSTFWWYLYYSADAGTTLTRVEGIAFSEYYTDTLQIPSSIASDRYMPGIVYLNWGSHIYWKTTDYGSSWERGNDGFGGGLGGVSAGGVAGEVSNAGPGIVSLDYGSSWFFMGEPPYHYSAWCCGSEPGIRYAQCGDEIGIDSLYLSTDYGATWEFKNGEEDFFQIASGVENEDLLGYGTYGIGETRILYSYDFGESFTFVCDPFTLDSPEYPSTTQFSIFSGWQRKEFFFVDSWMYGDPEWHTPIGGGEIWIWHTYEHNIFRLIKHSATGTTFDTFIVDGINELSNALDANLTLSAFPNPFNNSIIVKGDFQGNIKIVNFVGNIMAVLSGQNQVIWRPQNVSSGIYWFVDDKGRKARALYLK